MVLLKQHLVIIASVCFVFFIFVKPSFAASLEYNFNNGDLSHWKVVKEPGRVLCNSNWQINNHRVGIVIDQSSCVTDLVPDNTIWSNIGNNYTIDLDMFNIGGVDHNFAFRFGYDGSNTSTHSYEIHFRSPDDIVLGGTPPNDLIFPYNNPDRQTAYHVKIIVSTGNIKVYINNSVNPVIDHSYDHRNEPAPDGRIALRAGTGASTHTETWFDNITVTSLDNQTSLNVPLFRQTSPPWNTDTYDSANIWAPNNKTISGWGCAMTSAAMVFQYHGLTKMPDNTDLDPRNVNNWLKAQPDGYVNGGNVNWIALSRLSKLAKASGHNPNAQLDALEYARHGTTSAQLITDLTNKLPDILEEPGHYIVGTGVSDNTFTINDPFYKRSLLTDGYANKFLSLGTYSPSHTDLSYLMLITDADTRIQVVDNNQTPIGESFLLPPLVNDESPLLKSGSPVIAYYLPKPPDGDYNVTLTSQKSHTYSLQEFTYDMNGDVTLATQSGVINTGNPNTFVIHADKNNAGNNKTKKLVTYQSVITDINNGILLKLINNTLGKDLITLLQSAKKDNLSGRKIIEKAKLNAILVVLARSKGFLLTDSFSLILKQDVNTLLGK